LVKAGKCPGADPPLRQGNTVLKLSVGFAIKGSRPCDEHDTEDGEGNENRIAERMNGILKTEFNLKMKQNLRLQKVWKPIILSDLI